MARLTAAGIDDPARDARRLLALALGVSPARLTLALGEEIGPEVAERFDDLIGRRAARVPVSHLTGLRAFWGRDFAVTGDVLDPRPETEVLVAAALEGPFEDLLDLGTGSGCILLTLLAERAQARGTGTDLSGAALQVAARNRTALGLETRAELLEGSWFDPLPAGRRYDLVVSNPPYIAASEMAGLAPEVRGHEPEIALTDGGDGLEAYRAIAAGIGDRITPGGRLLAEIGPTQGTAVAGLFGGAGLRDVRVLRDLDGRDRVVAAAAPR